MWAHRGCTSLIKEHMLMVVHRSAFFAVVLPLRPNLVCCHPFLFAGVQYGIQCTTGYHCAH